MSNGHHTQNLRETAPLTNFQTALWANSRFGGNDTRNNSPIFAEWNCEIDVDRFDRAFHQVVQTTDTLRIVFEQIAGEITQSALDHVDYQLLHNDFRTDPNPRAAAIAWLAEIAAQPHTLTTTPFRTALARFGEKNWIWLLDQHHILTDYSTACLILSRLGQYYQTDRQDAVPTDGYPRFLELAPRIRAEDDKAPRQDDGETPDIFGERIITSTGQPDPGMMVHRFTLESNLADSFRSRKKIFDHLGATLIALVAALSSQIQFDVGLVINRRKRLQAEECCGPLLRTASLGISLPENPTASEIEDAWQRSVQESKRRHEGAELHQLPARVTFNFTLDPPPDFNGSPTVRLTPDLPATGTSEGMRLTVRPGNEPGTIMLFLTISAQLARATGGAKVLAQHFLSIHKFIGGNPSTRISEVDLLDGQSAEQERRLADATFERRAEIPDTIIDAFLRTREIHPDSTAISQDGVRITYKEADILSRRIAAALLERSVKLGDIVIVALPRSAEWIITALALFRIGAVMCPMDATASEERVISIVSETRATLRIASSTQWENELSVTFKELATHEGTALTDQYPTGQDRAYLMFTSGSTGKPKGVVIRHGSLVRFLEWFKIGCTLNASSVFGFVSPTVFDVTIRAFAMFLIGGEIRVYREEAGRLAIISCMIDDRSSFVICTPSVAAAMLQFPNLKRPSQLKVFALGGEGFTSLLYARLRAFLGPEVRILNYYGPTETTVAVSSHELAVDQPGSTEGKPFILPVGKAMPNSYFLIMNRDLRALPAGFAGEVYIGGNQLAEGYFDRSAETEKGFIASPFVRNRRLYRSGDVGKLMPDGTLVLLGRADRQLKFNGIRIEPVQVEMALAKHPEIVDVAVGLRGDPASLCAWYVSDREIPSAELRQIALKYIQPGTFPTKLMRVGQIPRTSNGKRKYESLPDQEVMPPVPATSFPSSRPPFGPIESDIITDTVIAIWRDVLQRTAPWDIDLTFDDLGGDSLTLMRMIFQVESLFGIDLEQVSIAKVNSVQRLSAKIKSIKAGVRLGRESKISTEEPLDRDATVLGFLSDVRRVLEVWPGEPVGESGLIRVLNKNGKKPALVWCFNDSSEPKSFSTALGPDRPLYILRSTHGLIDPDLKTWYDVQIAEIYARAIFNIFGTERIAIGGNCQASRIALVMASTLLHLKLDVVSVLLVEPAYPIPYPRRVMLLPGSEYSKINPLFGYANPHFGWKRYFRDYRLAPIQGRHGEYFHPKNVGSLADLVSGEMDAAISLPRLRLGEAEKSIEVKVSAVPDEWQAGNPGLVAVRLVAGPGCTLIMSEETGVTVSFGWDRDVPSYEPPRPWSNFPSNQILQPGEAVVVCFTIPAPKATGRHTLVIQLCEEGVGYFGEPARLDINLC